MALAAWNTWFDKLSPVGKETVEETRRSPVSRELAMHKTVVCDDAQLFKNSFAKLSEFTRTVIQEKVAAEMPVGDVVPNFTSIGYWIVECADGEAPKIKNVRTSVALAKYLSSAEGKDVYVFPFYGVPLPVTKGPQRYVYLPDGATALTVPAVKDGAVTEVDTETLLPVVKMQADYYFGPVEMITSVTFKEDKKKQVRQAPIPRNDDDYDD
jgi:hypothetical protein